jgi:hypothetical protein
MTFPEIYHVLHEMIMTHHFHQRKSELLSVNSPTITVSGLSHNHCLITLARSLTSLSESSVLSFEIDE